MITAFKFEHFRSYNHQARLPLAPLTVLIGANASGKSNAIEGLRLLSWLAQGNKLFNLSFQKNSQGRIIRGRPGNLAYSGNNSFSLVVETDHGNWNNLQLQIVCRNNGELHIEAESLTSQGATVPLYEIAYASSGNGTDVKVSFNNFLKGGNKPIISCIDQLPIFSQLTTPAPFSGYPQSGNTIPIVARLYEDWLASMIILDPVPASMRDYSDSPGTRISGDGANLSYVLYRLLGFPDGHESESAKANYAEILKFIQSLPEQDISSIDFLKEPRGGVLLQLTETFGGRKLEYDASLLSDGTLRVLAIAAAMLSAKEDSLVVIEEIDNGVHPSRAKRLIASIRSVAERRHLHVLITTHNPALLDAIPDPAISDVVFCYRDPADGSSKLVKLADIPYYPELIAQGTLGDLVTDGILERFVKNPQNKEERQARALAWLEKMRKGE
jgi:predicted ATPase